MGRFTGKRVARIATLLVATAGAGCASSVAPSRPEHARTYVRQERTATAQPPTRSTPSRRHADESYALLRTADQLSRSGDLEAAKQIYKKVLVTEPERVDVLVRLGNVHLALAEPWDAVTAFESAALLGGSNVQLARALSELWVELERLDEALRWNEEALTLASERGPLLLRRAQIQFLAQDLDAASRTLDQLDGASGNGQLAPAAKLRGYVELRRGNTEEAAVHFQAALELGARDPDLYAVVGKHYYDRGDFERAASFFGQRVSLGPDVAVEQYLVMSLARAGKVEEAREALTRFEEAHPRNVAIPTLHHLVRDGRSPR